MINDLFIRALKGEKVERPPVWMMRQAGRYLPQFRALRDKYDFFTRCRTPEIASEITVQPVDILGVDAAILFSDILVVPQAMNIEIQMRENIGPWVPKPIRGKKDLDRVVEPDVKEELSYVFQAIEMTKQRLNDSVPLIGFAGSPFTILCYVVEGQGSKNFDIAKSFCFQYPELAEMLLQKITNTTIDYLKEKIKWGVDAIQIFDSWGGILSPKDYMKYSWKYIDKIIEEIHPLTKVIIYAKGCHFALEQMARSKASAIGIDWTCSPKMARKLTSEKITLQGNLDPAVLLTTPKEIERQTKEMILNFGKDKYIANLGHGILPNVPVENARAFVEAVKSFK